MIELSLGDVAAAVGGRVAGDASLRVTGPAYVDSRRPEPGGLYVAVVGERVDGHDFADGAHAVLGSRPTSAPTVVVDDPVVALGRLARHVADRLAAPVLALTGSQGKTSTKDLLAHVLATRTPTVATAANNNNELGVPLTVLRADAGTGRLVVEMGARGIGHIAYLCELAPPSVAAVLNVGTAHLGEFGSREAIAAAKGEIVEALPATGVAVLNADDALVSAMAPRTAARVLTFGAQDGAGVTWRGVELDELGRPSFELGHEGRWAPVRLRVSGAHQVANAAAAAAMALAADQATDPAGLDLAAVAAGLSTAEPGTGSRMELATRADGLLVVNDAYNANPASMRAALEALAALGSHRTGRTIAVVGEMKELGEATADSHAEVGRAAAETGADVVVVVTGEDGVAAPIADGARAAGAREVIVTAGRTEALAWVRENTRADDVVLVKASNGAALEWLARELLGTEDDQTSTPGGGHHRP